MFKRFAESNVTEVFVPCDSIGYELVNCGSLTLRDGIVSRIEHVF